MFSKTPQYAFFDLGKPACYAVQPNNSIAFSPGKGEKTLSISPKTTLAPGGSAFCFALDPGRLVAYRPSQERPVYGRRLWHMRALCDFEFTARARRERGMHRRKSRNSWPCRPDLRLRGRLTAPFRLRPRLPEKKIKTSGAAPVAKSSHAIGHAVGYCQDRRAGADRTWPGTDLGRA